MTIDPRIPLMVQPVRSELDRQQSLADLAMRQQSTDLQRQQFEMGQEDRQEAQQARMTAQQRQQAEQIARLTTGVTDEATYQQRLAAARAYGIDVSQAPANYEPEWVQTQNTISQVLLRPEGQRELTTAAQQAEELTGRPISDPQTRSVMARLLTDTISVEPGGGAYGMDPINGPTTIFAPNPGSAATGAPAGGIQDGATATNPQTGERLVYRNGAWQSAGGSGGNTAGTFQP